MCYLRVPGSCMEPVTPSPFPIERNWVDDSGWKAPLCVVDRLSAAEVDGARDVLRTVFPPSMTDELRATNHPVVAEQYTYVGRLLLLELGLAIVYAGADEAEINRLRTADQYDGVSAEMRASFIFVRDGAQLARP